MATRTEGLVVKMSSDGSGNVSAELNGVAAAVKGIGEKSAATSAVLATMSGTLRNIALGGGALLGIHEITRAIGAVGGAALSAEQSEARLAGVLRATGANARTSAADIEALVQSLSKRAGLGDDEVRNAAARLLTFKNIQGDMFREALDLGADWAALFGGSITDGVEKVGRALQEPFNGVRALTRELGGLDYAQEATLKRFEALNDVAGAQKFTWDLLRSSVGGLAKDMNTGLNESVNGAAIAWDKFLEAVGRTSAFKYVAGEALGALRGATQLLTPDETAAPNTGTIKRSGVGGPNEPEDAVQAAQRLAEKTKLTADAAKFLADVQKENLAVQLQISAAANAATQALIRQASTYHNTAVEAAGLDITLGNLVNASAGEKAAHLVAAQAIDDKLTLEKELAQNEIQATERAVARAEAEQRTADAIKSSTAAQRDRAQRLAERGDPQGTARKTLEADTFAIEATFQEDADPTARLSALQQAQQDFVDATRGQSAQWEDAWSSAGNRFAAGIGDAVASVFLTQQTFAEAMETLAKSAIQQLISSLVELGVKKLALGLIEQSAMTAQTAFSAGQAQIVAAAWAPAASAVSLATAGANAVSASAGIASTYALTQGLSVIGQAHDGLDYVPRTGTYILEEGERVIKKDQNRELNDALKSGGAPNVNITFAISAMDGASVERMLKQRQGTISRIAVNAVQRAFKSTMRAGPLG